MIKFALVQYAPIFENKQASSEHLSHLLDKIDRSVDVIIFPELSLTGFTMRSQKYAEDLQGETIKFFSSLADRFRSHILTGFIEKEDGRCYNTLIHLDPAGKPVARYRKIHPFSFSGENRYYTAGSQTVITRINNFRIGLTICYDLRFPELFRFYAKERVHLIVDIANWPQSRIEHWHTLLKARSIEDQCYVIGVNRVGKDKKNEYNGTSYVFAPFGEEICRGGEQEEIIFTTLEIDRVIKVQSDYPFLNDIRLI